MSAKAHPQENQNLKGETLRQQVPTATNFGRWDTLLKPRETPNEGEKTST